MSSLLPFESSHLAGRLVPAGRGRLVAILIAILLHTLCLLMLVRLAPQITLQDGAPPAGGLRVTLVAARAQPTPVTPTPPTHTQPSKPRLAPVLTTPHPSARSVPMPTPVAAPSDTPPSQAQPQASPSVVPPAPAHPALNLPPAGQAVKDVASVACEIAQPSYPPRARRLGHEGTVLLRMTVDPTGRITRADVGRSSGFNELDDAARQTVFAGHCSPYLENGTAITVHAEQPIDFKLDQ